MIILVDAYNVIRSVFRDLGKVGDKHKKHFIGVLGGYKESRPKIREIIVVFDGGILTHATREVKCGVSVILAGQRSSADDWIVECAEKHKGAEVLVATNDRELGRRVMELSAAVIDSESFYMAARAEAEKGWSVHSDCSGDTLIKYGEDGESGSELDLLMDEASLGPVDKDGKKSDHARRGAAKGGTKSRAEKKMHKIIKKL
ncbi:hypothetical protein HOD08_00840 [bacterium]|nr:hypothetical protein [bacterium]